MSFQHFRLAHTALAQPLPPHLLQAQPQQIIQAPQFQVPTQPSATPASPSASASRAPYGSGDHDDGYSLVFPSLAAFHAWREQEEETQMVEFVKGDTHGSKAVPPRFKDHTKLVCARHSRSGRKKYVKKHPERVRKVPSRKIDGQGCSASISYKTYFDTDEVRACYNNHHSHEVGLANLPFTRRGRKAAVQQEKSQSKRTKTSSVTPSPMVAGSSNSISAPPMFALPHPFATPNAPSVYPQPQFGYGPQPPPPPQPSLAAAQERWDRMSVLFDSIRTHARAYEYPGPSVVALESVLIRLYLESPVGGAPGLMLPSVPNGQVQVPQLPPNGNTADNQRAPGVLQTNSNGNVNGVEGNEEDDDNGMTDDAE
jgi:hypothetical protein